jgi:hypothetical protein
LGALKILARPETWEADTETRAILTQEAMEFPARLRSGCNDAPVIPFYRPYVSELTEGSFDGDLFEQYWHIDNAQEPDPEFRYVLIGAGGESTALDITVRFARIPENCDISPYLSRLAVSSQNGIPYAFTIDILNAFGQHEIISDFLPFEKTDFELQEFRLVLGSDAAIVTITIDQTGDIFADCA